MNTLTYIGDAQAPEQTALNKKQRKIFLPKVAEFFPLLFPLKFATKRLLRWLGLIKKMFVQTFPAFLRCIKRQHANS